MVRVASVVADTPCPSHLTRRWRCLHRPSGNNHNKVIPMAHKILGLTEIGMVNKRLTQKLNSDKKLMSIRIPDFRKIAFVKTS